MDFRFRQAHTCTELVTNAVEGYSPRDGLAHGSLDRVAYVCADHVATARAEYMTGLSPYTTTLRPPVDEAYRELLARTPCGKVADFAQPLDEYDAADELREDTDSDVDGGDGVAVTRSIIRRVDWTCAREPSSPHPIHVFTCTTCGEASDASNDFEEARGWCFAHVGRNPSHTGFGEVVSRFWRMTGDGVDEVPAPRPGGAVDQAVTLSYAVDPPNCQACHDVEGGCTVCVCPNCGGRGAGVLPSGSDETECWRCKGTGRIRPLASRPILMYGAPYVPTYDTTTQEDR